MHEMMACFGRRAAILGVMSIQDSHIEILSDVVAIAETAAAAVMEVYTATDIGVEFKSDDSPVTAADMAAHVIITDGLRELTPTIPIISEEAADAIDVDADYSQYWLVDPIDGTKEFIRREDEFTVNIGLIEHGVPVLGVVVAPALGETFYGLAGHGAFKRSADGSERELEAAPTEGGCVAAVSKSHQNEATVKWLHQHAITKTVSAGSSLKFCRVAEGEATVYPRMGSQHFWDTAAADAVLRAAGGDTVVAATNKPLRYDVDDALLTPHYIAKARGVTL